MNALSRPDDGAIVPLVHAIIWQRDYVAAMDAPVAAAILEAVRSDLAGAGHLEELVPATVRFGDLMALRIMAAVHRLALQREAPAVALHLPTLGGSPPKGDHAQAFAEAVVESLATHPDVLRRSLDQAPQTNEVGRAALLRCALSRLPGDRPVRLREIGCSAGLNLRADHLPGTTGLESGPLPTIQDRVGCDLHPVDPTTTEGRIHLTSYVWVDHVERYQRLRQALDIAARYPAVIVQEDAASFVHSLQLQDGTTTVLWHSVMWPYLSDEQRQGVLKGTRALGRTATAERSLAHVSWEGSGRTADPNTSFELVLRTWQGVPEDGEPFALAEGTGHGLNSVLLPNAPMHLSEEPLRA